MALFETEGLVGFLLVMFWAWAAETASSAAMAIGRALARTEESIGNPLSEDKC